MTDPITGPEPSFEPPEPQFHLMVIATRETLPQPLEVVHPRGDGGAPVGVPIPVRKEPGSLHLLRRPMEPGRYAFESENGVVVATVIPRNPGDPYPGQSTSGGDEGLMGLGPAERERLDRGRWTILLEMMKPEGEVVPAVLFQTRLADRIASMAEGAILDREGFRAYLPGAWRDEDSTGPFDIKEHVAVHLTSEADGAAWVHTHGLAKFGRHELEISGVPEELEQAAVVLLWGCGDYVARGAVIKPGETVGEKNSPLFVRLAHGRLDNHYVVPALELVDMDEGGAPVESGATRGINAVIAASEV